MKSMRPLLAASFAIVSTSCEKESPPQAGEAAGSEAFMDLQQADLPLLPIKKGDLWRYAVRVQISEGVTSEGASEVDVEQEKTRTYLGKISIGEGYPEVDAFEVEAPGIPVQWELVEIFDDRIMMRGSASPGNPNSRPQWYEPAIPFVVAGLRAGQETVKDLQGGASQRQVKVVARERVTVAAGEFSTIRLLMTGVDGDSEIRRTTWFAPKVGIMKEEKARYANDKLLFRETTELVETSVTTH
jgi:hypothetical protein